MATTKQTARKTDQKSGLRLAKWPLKVRSSGAGGPPPKKSKGSETPASASGDQPVETKRKGKGARPGGPKDLMPKSALKKAKKIVELPLDPASSSDESDSGSQTSGDRALPIHLPDRPRVDDLSSTCVKYLLKQGATPAFVQAMRFECQWTDPMIGKLLRRCNKVWGTRFVMPPEPE